MKKLKAVLPLGLFCVLSMTQPALAGASENASQPTTEQLAREIETNTRYLARKALAKAQSLLERYDDFAPFGAALFPSGDVRYVWAIKPGEDTEDINPTLVLNSVRSALAAQAGNGRILGSAVIYKYKPSADSSETQINIELEYLSGFAQVLATEYEKSADGYTYGIGATANFDPIVFADE